MSYLDKLKRLEQAKRETASTTLLDRIKRGEDAIAEAKAEGRDVAEWEAHLAELKREAFESPTKFDAVGVPECWNCGAMMTATKNIEGRSVWVCWSCAKQV